MKPATSKTPFQVSPIFTICFPPTSAVQPVSGFNLGFLKITTPPTEVDTNLSATEGNRIPWPIDILKCVALEMA